MEDLAKMIPLARSGIISPESFLKSCERLVKRHAAGVPDGEAPAKKPCVVGQPASNLSCNLPGRQPAETASAAVARRRVLDDSPQAIVLTPDPSSTRPFFDSPLREGNNASCSRGNKPNANGLKHPSEFECYKAKQGLAAHQVSARSGVWLRFVPDSRVESLMLARSAQGVIPY